MSSSSSWAGEDPSYLGEEQPFYSVQALNWLDKGHLLRREIGFTQSTNSNINLIPKYPHTQNNLTKYLGTRGSIKLTHKINHHSRDGGNVFPCQGR